MDCCFWREAYNGAYITKKRRKKHMKKQGNLLMKLTDLVGLTFLWVIGCIPIVTIFTSTAAMYHTVVTCVRGGKAGITAEFKAAYLRNLKQGILLTLLYGAAGGLLGAGNYFVFGVNETQSSEMMILAISTIIVTMLYILNILWLIPVLAKASGKFNEIMKLTYTAATKNIGKGLLMLWIVFAVAVGIRIFLPLAVILPAASAMWNSYLAEPALERI